MEREEREGEVWKVETGKERRKEGGRLRLASLRRPYVRTIWIKMTVVNKLDTKTDVGIHEPENKLPLSLAKYMYT